MKSEIESLLHKSQQSLQAARLLFEGGLYNLVVSQAYYAMFYVASAALLSRGLKFRRHSGLIAAFGKQLAKEGLLPRHLHRYLLDAFDQRARSDYLSSEEATSEEALEQLRQAEEFVDTIKAFLEKEPQI